jgi:LysM repeat protein
MRWRLLLVCSLAANLLLAAGWLASSAARRALAKPEKAESKPEAASVKTNVVVRKQFFTWEQIETDDYPSYIANLRAIDCPEQTIRDIIIADVNALYSRKRSMDPEIISPEQEWWRTTPDTTVLRVSLAKLTTLERERRALLTRLLGPDWEGRDLANLPRPSHPTVALDGPVLGPLSDEVKQQIEDINARSQDRIQAYIEAEKAAGRLPDPVQLARLRQQTRRELASALGPGPMEEFLLRYSQSASDLRGELRQLQYFNVSSNEFRLMFDATDPYNNQIALIGGDDPNAAAQRQALAAARDNALKTVLGPARYAEFQLLHDPAYRDAVAAADQAGTPEAADTVYQINLATQTERQQIMANTNLNDAQRAVALKQMELDQLTASAQATGQIPLPEPALPTQPVSPPPPAPSIPHIIQPGETLLSLAFRYGTTMDAIVGLNQGLDINNLKPGDAIRLPQRPGN